MHRHRHRRRRRSSSMKDQSGTPMTNGVQSMKRASSIRIVLNTLKRITGH